VSIRPYGGMQSEITAEVIRPSFNYSSRLFVSVVTWRELYGF